MQIHFYQAQDIGSRDEQQDALGNLVLAPQQKLYVLADGMGGQTGGQTASTTVVNAFLAYFQQHGAADAEHALQQALQAANAAVAAVLAQQLALAGMGTTVVAVVVDEAHNRYRYISVGDSPLYLLHRGRLQRINANHAFAEDLKKMVASGEMSAAEAERHPARHAVTSALTGGGIAHIDSGSGILAADDKLLLASDGVQTLSDMEIENTLNSVSGSLEAQVGGLLAVVAAKQNPHQDNVSLVLVRAAPQAAAAPATEPGRRTAVVTEAPAAAARTSGSGRYILRVALAVVLVCAAATVLWWWLAGRPPAPPPEVLPPGASEVLQNPGAEGAPPPLAPADTASAASAADPAPHPAASAPSAAAQ